MFLNVDPRLKAIGDNQFGSMKEWFDKRLEEAYTAAEEREAQSSK